MRPKRLYLLILDEATSNLDDESAKKIIASLKWFKTSEKTIVFITHNKSIFTEIDEYIYLEGGKVVNL